MSIQDKVAEIAKLCVEVTMNTEHDVFFEYMAHVNGIDIKIFNGGWKKFKKYHSIESYLDNDDTELKLNLITQQLQELLK